MAKETVPEDYDSRILADLNRTLASVSKIPCQSINSRTQRCLQPAPSLFNNQHLVDL